MSGNKEPVTADVAIVGGGFSGTMVAAQLARRGLTSVIIEKAGQAGRGTAFSTREPSHLLNVRAGRMSAWPDRPDDFVAWLEGKTAGGAVGRDGFAQRRDFGAYLRAILDEAMAGGLVRLIDGEAIAARRDGDGWRVSLSDGATVVAKALALANGNQPPDALRLPGLNDSALLVSDPWNAAGRERIAAAATAQAPVLIVGTGLTMLDLVQTLDAAGHDAPVTAVSRRGLLHHAHSERAEAAIEAEDVPAGLMPLWRWLRGKVAAGDDWRERIDSLRPLSVPLWRGLSEAEQRRFMRHARPWWDVHRHRIAPAVAAQVEQRMARGKLEVIAGRIRSAEAAGEGLRVTITRRGRSTGSGQAGGEAVRAVGLAINATGPLHALVKTRDPLLRQLLDERLVAPDRLGIGVDCEEGDAARGTERLWVLGPLTKARRWEIIAVPDIAGQAEAVAEAICRTL